MTRIDDLRIKSLDEAKSAMAKLARLATTIELWKARSNSKISTIKHDLQGKLIPVEAELDAVGKSLGAFIEANRGLFEKPKKIKCEGGAFGLQKASGIEITDEAALMIHLLEEGYDDCIEIVRKPNKAAIKTRLESGCPLPGVTQASGETVVYKVDPKLLKEAKETP